jgi:hypothetical protein
LGQLHPQDKEFLNNWFIQSGGVTKLADVSVFHPRNPGEKLARDRKYFQILFVSQLYQIAQ